MTNIITTGIAIDSSDAVKAKKDLDNLAGSGDKVDGALTKIDNAGQKVGKTLATLSSNTRKVADNSAQMVSQMQNLNAAQARQEQILRSIGSAFTGLTAAMKNTASASQAQAKASKEAAQATKDEATAAKEAARAAREQQLAAEREAAAKSAAAAAADRYLCSLVILSPDVRKKLLEIPIYTKVGYPNSIQGVAWDETDNTIWFVDQGMGGGSGGVRHIDLAGNWAGGEFSPGYMPNLLCRIPAEDALIVPRYNGTSLDVISCATGAVLRTVSGIRSGHDQGYYDADTNRLWYTVGNNGSDGMAIVMDMSTGEEIDSYPLPGSESIEGIWKDGDILTVLNDGAFHVAAKPPLSLACRYRLTYQTA